MVRVDNIPDENIWDAHCGAKAYLFQYIEETTGTRLDPDILTIGPPATEISLDDNHAEADLKDLYNKLENVIIPLYYQNRTDWIRVMKNAIGKNAYYFNTHVMMRRYVTEAYIR